MAKIPAQPSDTPPPASRFVSRGGLKLQHALESFKDLLDARGLICADFGSSTGGFTDCLLQAGASRVTTIDTAYGILAYKLRIDPRVKVIERTNALHAAVPPENDRMDLVVMDMGWTPQRLCVPAAAKWLRADGKQLILSLIKPHYELTKAQQETMLVKGVLDQTEAEKVTLAVLDQFPSWEPPLKVLGCVKSPILGGATRGKTAGNAEWLALATLEK